MQTEVTPRVAHWRLAQMVTLVVFERIFYLSPTKESLFKKLFLFFFILFYSFLFIFTHFYFIFSKSDSLFWLVICEERKSESLFEKIK